MQVPSPARRIRPAQSTGRADGPPEDRLPLALPDFAASWLAITALRNPTALSSRYCTPGSLIWAGPSMVAHAAVSLSDNPPGPRASARRSRLVPVPTLRLARSPGSARRVRPGPDRAAADAAVR